MLTDLARIHTEDANSWIENRRVTLTLGVAVIEFADLPQSHLAYPFELARACKGEDVMTR